MSTFRVDPDALRAFGQQLDDAIAEVEQAGARLRASSPAWGGPGFAAAESLASTHDALLAQMRQLVHQIHAGTASSQEAATQIAHRYESTDDHQSVSMTFVENRIGHDSARDRRLYAAETAPPAHPHVPKGAS